MRFLALDTRNSNKLRSFSNETSDSGGQGAGGQAFGSASSDGSKNSGRSGEASAILTVKTPTRCNSVKNFIIPYFI
jgi:hypothetical protein